MFDILMIHFGIIAAHCPLASPKLMQAIRALHAEFI
jgi:hypothetical protein